MTGFVAWIMVAPVKALALAPRETVELTEHGVPENRRFHLIDERSKMVNNKLVGPLMQIGAEYDPAAERLSLRLPDGAAVEAQVAVGEPINSQFYGRPRAVRPVLGPFSEAISDFAGRSLRLVQPEHTAVDRGRDGAISMISTAACDGFDPRRFRMLFGIGGVPAHAEDEWVGYRVRIGDAVVRPLSETGRCLITSQDPDTGVPDMDMLDWIRRNRPDDTGEPLPFGVHGKVVAPGTVRVGAPVGVIQPRGTEPST